MTRFIVLFALLATLPLQASDNKKTGAIRTIDIQGSVVDIHNGEALTGVCVQLAGTRHKTYTDLDGHFSFENISVAEYLIISEYISYKTKKVQATPRENQFMIIRMESL